MNDWKPRIWRENVAWIDQEHNEYSLDELTNEHLVNILRYLGAGNNAHEWFVTEEVIKNLRIEALNRGLKIK